LWERDRGGVRRGREKRGKEERRRRQGVGMGLLSSFNSCGDSGIMTTEIENI